MYAFVVSLLRVASGMHYCTAFHLHLKRPQMRTHQYTQRMQQESKHRSSYHEVCCTAFQEITCSLFVFLLCVICCFLLFVACLRQCIAMLTLCDAFVCVLFGVKIAYALLVLVSSCLLIVACRMLLVVFL